MIELSPEDLKRREDIFKAIPEGEIYTTCLVRRRKSKSGKPRFYIYDSNDQLTIAAECDFYKDCNYIISLDAKEFSKQSPFKIGELTHRRYDSFYCGEVFKDGSFQKYMKINFLSHYAKKTRKRQMIIEFEPSFKHSNELIQNEYFEDSFKARFPDLSDKFQSSSKNFYISLDNGKHGFSLAKMYKDEFHLAISYPLSILDGFLIALSTFQILKNE